MFFQDAIRPHIEKIEEFCKQKLKENPDWKPDVNISELKETITEDSLTFSSTFTIK